MIPCKLCRSEPVIKKLMSIVWINCSNRDCGLHCHCLEESDWNKLMSNNLEYVLEPLVMYAKLISQQKVFCRKSNKAFIEPYGWSQVEETLHRARIGEGKQ